MERHCQPSEEVSTVVVFYDNKCDNVLHIKVWRGKVRVSDATLKEQEELGEIKGIFFTEWADPNSYGTDLEFAWSSRSRQQFRNTF